MRAFAESYSEPEFVQQVVAQIPWGHNTVLLEKVKDLHQRLWYARKIVEHGWSRAILMHQIEGQLYHRQGKALTNFDHTLPPLQSDMAQQVL
jgi:predicted nuclease of restriction endonuclease-like (RecB) superfamily